MSLAQGGTEGHSACVSSYFCFDYFNSKMDI